MDLRPYQVEALRGGRGYPGIYGALRAERSRALAVLATGCGKTILFAKAAEACVSRGKRVMIIAHRRELITQAREKLIAATSLDAWRIGIEMGNSFASPAHDVVVASVQTLSEARLSRFRADEFRLLIIDEAHHATAATYQRILTHFADAKVLGVTATPDQLVGRDVFPADFAFRYDIADAIGDGYLVPLRSPLAISDAALDLSEVKTRGGDFVESDLAHVMGTDAAVAVVAKGLLEQSGERPTITFTASVQQAHDVAGYLNSKVPGLARALDGTVDEWTRARTLRDYATGRFRILVNCLLFTEGFDCPRISCVAVARPTKSRALYTQMVGRGTRLCEGKEDLLILDFAGATGRHRLASALDLMGEVAEDVRRKVKARQERGEQVEILTAIAEAKAELAEEELLRLERKKAAAVDRAKYTITEMGNPLELGMPRRLPGEYAGHATEDDLELLQQHGVPGATKQLARLKKGRPLPVEDIDADQARRLLWEIQRRKTKRLCSLRQAKILQKYGLNTEAKASAVGKMMQELADARWQASAAMIERWQADPKLAKPAAPAELAA